MQIEEYHSHPALGSSLLSVLLKNAKIFKRVRDRGFNISNKNLDIGSALHCFVLEPEKFDDYFMVVPDINKRTKEGKKIIEEFSKQKKTLLTKEDFAIVKQMSQKLGELKKMRHWLKIGEAEKSFFGEYNGVEIKCRPDLLVKTSKGYLVIDLKTTATEATPQNFAKSSANFLYYLQEAVYREVLKQNDIEVIKFLFAYVSKQEVSGAIYCEHDYIALEEGETLLQKAIQKYRFCNENNIWKEEKFDFETNSFEKINTISLPTYAFYQFL